MTISSYCSIPYLAVFLPAVLVLYGVSPKKARPFTLLFSSYGFFWLISGKLLVYLLLSTFSIHHTGIWLALTFTEQREQMELAAKEDRKTIRAVFSKSGAGSSPSQSVCTLESWSFLNIPLFWREYQYPFFQSAYSPYLICPQLYCSHRPVFLYLTGSILFI